MKRLLLICCTGLMMSITAHAQNRELKNDIQDLLQDIQSELNTNNSTTRELEKARRQLLAVRDLLRNGDDGGNNGGGQNRPGRLTCVSRDNDGREPYAISIQNPRDFSETRIPNVVLSRSECETTIQEMRMSYENVIFCASRDNDGRNPYSLVAYNQRSNSVKRFGVYNDIQECKTAFKRAAMSRTHISICASRDNDGRNPYAKMVIEMATMTARMNANVYSDMQSCLNSN